jgi:hypothetical protein
VPAPTAKKEKKIKNSTHFPSMAVCYATARYMGSTSEKGILKTAKAGIGVTVAKAGYILFRATKAKNAWGVEN